MKKLLAFLLVFSMIFALAGCDGAAEPYPESGPESQSKPEPASSGPESKTGPISVAPEGTVKEITLTGVVAEFVPGLFFLTLEDGSQTAFQADAIEGYEVRVGDTVTIQYTDDGKSFRINSVEVNPAAEEETAGSSQTAAPAASSQAASSQAASSQAASSQGVSSQAGPSWATGQRASYTVTAVVVRLTANMVSIDQEGRLITLDRKLFEGRLGHTFRIGDLLTIGYYESGNMGWPVSMAVTGFDPTVDPDDYDDQADWDQDDDDDDNDDIPSNKPSSGGAPVIEEPADAADVYEAVRLTNVERGKEDLPDVTIDPTMMDMAKERAREITGKFAHERPDNSSFYSIFGEYDWEYSLCAENIFAGRISAAEAIKWWMNSPGHRANILREGVTKIGIGYCYDGDATYKHYWVMLLATPKE